MPKQKLAKKKKIIVRKGYKFVVKPRKRRVVNNVKNLTASTCLVDYKIDLDTPLHRFASKFGNKLESSCEMDIADTDETVEDVQLIKKQMPVDPAASMQRTAKFGNKLESSCEMDIVDTDQTVEDVQLIKKQMPVDAAASMQRIAKFDDQLENSSELDTDRTVENLEFQMSDDADDGANIVHGGGNDENEENGKKILVLKVDVLNPIQSKESLADTESNEDQNSEPDIPKDFNGSQTDIENAKIKIDELIDGGNPIWEEIMERYHEDASISKRLRKAMIEAIVQYARVKRIYIDLESMKNISFQICKVFPTEIMSTYFMPKAGGKGYSGSLYNLYHRKRSNDNKEQKEQSINKTIEPETALSEPTDSIAVLKIDGYDDHVYIEKWKETFEYRQKKISHYETFDDFIDEWPIIMKEIGLHLIEMDFEKIHGARSITSHNWNSFFSNNAIYLKSNINRKGNSFFRKVIGLEESPAKDAALSFILHYLLQPAYGAAGWKPTCDDSQNTFLKFIKNECIDTEIANRNKTCVERGIKWHPYIIGQGRSKRKMKNFIVVVHSTKFQCKDFLTALEFCLYLYLLLDIPYPPESKAVWILVNRLFMNVKVQTQITSRIHQIVNDIN